MGDQSVRSVVGSGLAALPWCCIAPAAFAVSGVAASGVGAVLQWAMPVFLALSVGLLGRSLWLSLVKRRGLLWVRAVVLLSTPVIGLIWGIRLGWVDL